jgi:LPPG:FO 2-phospho-L-lactate transferase
MIVALAGGVGGARLAVGLATVLPPSELTVIVNTGDDFEHMGFTVCPDLDTVMYTLAGVNNPQTGWGRDGETWQFMNEVDRLGGESWFRLGDRDLAVHVLRREALHRGVSLSAVTRDLAVRFGIRHAILPMSDTPVRTRVKTKSGELTFQDYFVRRRCMPRVTGFRFKGSRAACVPDALQRLMRSRRVEAVVLCPSNPFVSIAPILSGMKPSTLSLANHYGDAVDQWVIDRQDAGFAGDIERLGKRVLVADTVMTSRNKSAALARKIVRFAQNK